MSIASTGSPAHWLPWRGLALAAVLAAFCPLPAAAAETAKATHLPQTENEKAVFDAIKNNQLQAAINALLKAPEGQRVAIAELADEHGMTALHWTVANRNASGLRWLLDKGPELELKDDQGRTPLRIALDNQHMSAMTLLIARGANTSTALPGHDEKLKALKKTDDIIDFMFWAAAVDATDTPAAAAAFYQKACSTRQPVACLKLGLRHHRGDGIPKDLAKAAELYRTACDADEASMEACHWLAGLQMTGEGVAKDTAKAAALYTRACDGGYANGCYMLGLYYNEGKALAKDDAKAVALFTKACDLWIVRACTSLGYMYQNGFGVTKDASKAMGFYRKACVTAEPDACLSLGLMYRQGGDVPKDPGQAAPLFSTACDAGNAQACHNIASMHVLGEGMPKDLAKAIALYQKACDGKYAAACLALGSYYYLGKDLPRDWPKAAAFFGRACDGDRAIACYMLGAMYREGEGVAADKTKAAALIAKACKLGEQKACKPAIAAAPAAPSAAAPAAAQPGAGACKFGRVALGVDTVASVERDITARGGTPSVGSNGHYRRINTLAGDYSDVLPDGFMAINHDFDMGTASGRLVAVTVAKHALSAPEFERLLANRKAAIGKSVGPIQQTATSPDQVFQAASAHCRAKLVANAQTWWIYEIYELPN